MKRKIKEQILSSLSALIKAQLTDHQQLSPEIWDLSYEQSELGFQKIPLSIATQKWETPLHVYLEDPLKRNLQKFQTSNVEVFLSYKTNPVPAQLKYLHNLGAGAEVISAYELWLALKLGVNPKSIIYNGPAKSDESIEIAIDKDILLLNFNHFEEIERVKTIAKRKKKSVNVGLRITSSGWAGQFGFRWDQGQVHEVMELLLKTEEFNVIGLHCHRGVSIRNESDLAAHIEPMLTLCEAWWQKFRWAPKILDFGGSLGIPTVRSFSRKDIRLAWALAHPPKIPDPQATLSPSMFSKMITEKVKAQFARLNQPIPRIAIEPGRSLTASSQMLLTRIVDIKQSQQVNYLILDAGGCHARIIESKFHQIFPLKENGAAKICYRLVGPICHTGDIISRVWYGPPLNKGDYLCIMDSGAYFISDSAAFSFPRAGVCYLTTHGEWKLARKSEQFEDMSALDIF